MKMADTFHFGKPWPIETEVAKPENGPQAKNRLSTKTNTITKENY